MSKPNQKPQQPVQPIKTPAQPTGRPANITGANEPLSIKFAALWLALLAFVLYYPSISYTFTELDDSIFIRDFAEYNDNLKNIIGAFGRGLFNATKDPYYRPIFSDSMIMNYHISGIEIGSYHVVNILLHVASVLLLYKLFLKLHFRQLHAFLLAAIFAVIPVLTQAVAWIPGRNDTLLAVFTLSFFIFAISYSEEGKKNHLLFSILFLLLALFTKETAVFVAPAAFILLLFVLGTSFKSKNNLTLYGSWVGCFAVWYIARAAATVHITTTIGAGQMLTDFLHRLPIIIQYLGKIFFPFNLSVFPIQEDTVSYFGLAAVALIAALLFFSKNVNWKVVAAGFTVFLFFLLPALLVPANLNEQVFEHRLYLPVIGILIVLSQTAIFKKLADKQLLIAVLAVCSVFFVVTFNHEKNFSDAFAFWHQASATSPHSAYANMMLGAREDKAIQEQSFEIVSSDERKTWIKEPGENLQKSFELFTKAYQQNPNEKYLNFYYGCMLQKKDSVMASEAYFLKEKKISDYIECDFYLARIAMMKQDTTGAMNYLKSYLQRAPANPQANNNLLLMYFSRGQFKEAKDLATRMRMAGLPVPAELMQKLNAMQL